MEYTSISSHSSSGLVDRLREHDADGWRVLGITSNHEGLVAILCRGGGQEADRGDSSTASTASPSAFAMGAGGDSSASNASGSWGGDASSDAPVSVGGTATEPAGWGKAPDPAPAASEPVFGAAGSAWGSQEQRPSSANGAGGLGGSVAATHDHSSTISTTATPVSSSAAAIPAGWYSDPSNRYELRYWDGNGWTEHVSRAGHQYTDPPVA